MKIVGKIDFANITAKPKRKLRKDESYVSDSNGNCKIFRNQEKALKYFTKKLLNINNKLKIQCLK